MIELLINSFVILFVVIDPIAVVPVFSSLTHGADEAYTRSMAIKGVLVATAILMIFFLAGHWILHALGISLPAFRIAGGTLLLLLAIDMVFARQSGLRSTTDEENQEARTRQDISVFPVAFPLLAGPGAMTTVIYMSTTYTYLGAKIAIGCIILLVLQCCMLALIFANRIMRLLGETGANVVSRIFGVLLAALASQFILDGVKGAFPSLG
jgi:multiple antibiotic resistance protein